MVRRSGLWYRDDQFARPCYEGVFSNSASILRLLRSAETPQTDNSLLLLVLNLAF